MLCTIKNIQPRFSANLNIIWSLKIKVEQIGSCALRFCSHRHYTGSEQLYRLNHVGIAGRVRARMRCHSLTTRTYKADEHRYYHYNPISLWIYSIWELNLCRQNTGRICCRQFIIIHTLWTFAPNNEMRGFIRFIYVRSSATWGGYHVSGQARGQFRCGGLLARQLRRHVLHLPDQTLPHSLAIYTRPKIMFTTSEERHQYSMMYPFTGGGGGILTCLVPYKPWSSWSVQRQKHLVIYCTHNCVVCGLPGV